MTRAAEVGARMYLRGKRQVEVLKSKTGNPRVGHAEFESSVSQGSLRMEAEEKSEEIPLTQRHYSLSPLQHPPTAKATSLPAEQAFSRVLLAIPLEYYLSASSSKKRAIGDSGGQSSNQLLETVEIFMNNQRNIKYHSLSTPFCLPYSDQK